MQVIISTIQTELVTQNGFDLLFLDSNGGSIRFDDSNSQLLVEGTIIGTTPKLVVKGEVSFGTVRINDQYSTEIIKYSQVGTGGILSLTQATSSVARTQTFQDADGVIALLSDIPNLSGSGTTNYVTRWTSANTLGIGVIQDSGTTTGVNSLPVNLNMLSINGNGTTQFGIAVDNSNGLLNTGITTSASGGGQATGIRSQSGATTGGVSTAGLFQATTSHTGDNYGVVAEASNGGAGNHWAIQIIDGTEGVGKVLTSDASGRANWQTPSGSATWQPPTKDLSAYLGNGASTLANANAGFQKSFSATANNEVLAEVTLFNNNVNYDGSDLQIRLRWQLFNTAPGVGDDVIWEVDYVFLLDGDDGDSKAATLITDTIDVSGRTANQLYTDVISTNLTGVANAHTLGITIRRRSSGGGADSYPSAADVFGIELLKV
jgi:hypothetical protein